MTVARWRRAAAIYLALFFCAVALSQHHHVNGLEDLLLDQRSDSGLIEQPVAPPQNGAAFRSVRYVQDVPCPACFTSDFVATATALIVVVPRPMPLSLRPDAVPASRPDPLPTESASRAPPSV
jgi:hypothetical protein